MFKWFIFFMMLTTSIFAEVGSISKLLGSGDAYVQRGTQKINLSQNSLIEKGDEVFSQNSIIQILLYPTTQISLSKDSHIKISESLIEGDGLKEKSSSVIDFIKGIIRLQVTRDESLEIGQKVQASGVAFAVRGTEFEVSKDAGNIGLEVVEGEVEVTSPHVNTFVPEIIKANEGFSYNQKEKSFNRRKFALKFKNHPQFIAKKEVLEKWKQKKQINKDSRLKRKDQSMKKKIKRIQRNRKNKK